MTWGKPGRGVTSVTKGAKPSFRTSMRCGTAGSDSSWFATPREVPLTRSSASGGSLSIRTMPTRCASTRRNAAVPRRSTRTLRPIVSNPGFVTVTSWIAPGSDLDDPAVSRHGTARRSSPRHPAASLRRSATRRPPAAVISGRSTRWPAVTVSAWRHGLKPSSRNSSSAAPEIIGTVAGVVPRLSSPTLIAAPGGCVRTVTSAQLGCSVKADVLHDITPFDLHHRFNRLITIRQHAQRMWPGGETLNDRPAPAAVSLPSMKTCRGDLAASGPSQADRAAFASASGSPGSKRRRPRCPASAVHNRLLPGPTW